MRARASESLEQPRGGEEEGDEEGDEEGGEEGGEPSAPSPLPPLPPPPATVPKPGAPGGEAVVADGWPVAGPGELPPPPHQRPAARQEPSAPQPSEPEAALRLFFELAGTLEYAEKTLALRRAAVAATRALGEHVQRAKILDDRVMDDLGETAVQHGRLALRVELLST